MTDLHLGRPDAQALLADLRLGGAGAQALGERLRRLRRDRGFTQLTLAALAGLSNSAVSLIECGRRRMTINNAHKLAAALGTTVDDLVAGDGWTDAATRERIEWLRSALDHIRVAAGLHYLGQAFDPEHMRAIANLATRALAGEPIPGLIDPEGVRSDSSAWDALLSDEDSELAAE